MEKLSKEQILSIQYLTPREQQIIRLRFGLDDGKERTLAEIGDEFNITRERVRQIEVKIMRKLNSPKWIEKMQIKANQ